MAAHNGLSCAPLGTLARADERNSRRMPDSACLRMDCASHPSTSPLALAWHQRAATSADDAGLGQRTAVVLVVRDGQPPVLVHVAPADIADCCWPAGRRIADRQSHR